jgi:hypothetical protein
MIFVKVCNPSEAGKAVGMETEIRPKNLLVDGFEIYLLKMAIEAPSVPLICKITGVLFGLYYQSQSYYSELMIRAHAEYVQAWGDLLNNDTAKAREVVIGAQNAGDLMHEAAKEEWKNPASRLRIIIWLVLIAVVVIVPLVLMTRH